MGIKPDMRLIWENFSFSTHALDNWCDNALELDLSNGKLIIDGDLPFGTNCEWLISAIDDKHYVNMEFEIIDVSNF